LFIRFFLMMVLLLFSTEFSKGETSDKTTKVSLTAIAQKAEEIASTYHDLGWFSGSLLLAKDGEVFYSQSFGYRDIETKARNTVHTKFNLGSIMKNFTKVLVLQQVDSGKLSLTDTLDRFELGFPAAIASKINLSHLLDHRSGFGDIFIAEYREDQLAYDSIQKKLQLLKDRPLLFEPGTDRKYSNYGYIVLGAVLEKITGRSFERLLSDQIFDRIQLSNTSFRILNSSEHQSKRYTYLYDSSLKLVGATEHPSPDGGIESTVHDVQKFYHELFFGSALLDRSNPIVKDAFGMSGEHWAAYGGGLGVSAAVEIDLTQDIEIVVLANTDKLVAEFISGRIKSFINTGTYKKIRPHEINFAYSFYKDKGKDQFYRDFKETYTESGYSQFIGRVINELGMQLLKTKSWSEAFDVFNYLVFLFPSAPQAYDSLAFAYFKKGDPETAYKTFTKALELSPDFRSDYISDNFGHSPQ